jgi:hypothetical protein
MAKKTIITPLPENYEPWMEPYFLKRQKQKVRQPEIKRLKNVFVNHYGLVLKNGIIKRRSAFNLFGNEDNTFGFAYWKILFEQYIISKFGKSLPSVKLTDDKTYLLIHSKWFNYSFWVNSFLARLLHAEEVYGLENLVLIYPEGWDHISYASESLEPIQIERIRIPNDHHLFVKNLILPETRAWTASFDPTQIQKVRERFVPLALERTKLTSFPKNIYLTRNKRKTRSIENEDELTPILLEHDFTILNFEDYSFWDQVALMHNAKSFVSIHGAGFSNCLFMQPKSAVMELINKAYADLEYKFPFWKLACAAELNYFVQFGNPKNQNKKLRRGSAHDHENVYLADENILIESGLFSNNIVNLSRT